MKALIILSNFFIIFSVHAQSGYLGRVNSIELGVDLAPTFAHRNYIKDDVAYRSLRILNPSYGIKLGRVFFENLEIAMGYKFAVIYCTNDRSAYKYTDSIFDGNEYEVFSKQVYFLEDPKMTYHSFAVSLRYYRLGSLAPIGKYIGVDFDYGFSTLSAANDILVGRADIKLNDGILTDKKQIGLMYKGVISEDVNIRAINIRLVLGRMFPINDFIILNTAFLIPLISEYNSNYNSRFGFQLKKGYLESSTSSWNRYAMTSIRYYKKISLNIGLKILF